MSHGNVPFYFCRPGAVLEFDIYGTNRKERGTVNALIFAGAHNFLVELSESVDAAGVVKKGLCSTTGSLRAVNLDHATQVLQHGQGALVFHENDYANGELRKELAEARADGTISRRGQRIVIDGNRKYAPNIVRTLLLCYVSDNRQTFGWLPWEVLDLEALSKVLAQVGIISYKRRRVMRNIGHRMVEEPEAEYIAGAEVNTVKLKRYLKANFNRFKADLGDERRERERFDEEMYRRDLEREEEIGYGGYGGYAA